MSRYIDADKLRDDWIDEMNEPIYVANDVLDSIDEQSTADVVEVVRCSDCKYCELYMQDQGYMEPPTCEGIICSKHKGLYMDFTDYCSYGERREKMSNEHEEQEYDTMIEDMNLDNFRDSGALWWINRQLHLLGMALALDVDEKGHCYNLRPVWCKFRGFDEEHETLGFEMLSRYIADNGKVLLSDAQGENE